MVEIKIDEFELNNNLNNMSDAHKDILKSRKRLERILHNIKIIDDYLSDLVQHAQQKSLNNLTYINLIFLPLTLITGYFGMNFKAMGNPVHGRGILSHSHGQTVVFILFIASVMLFTFVYRYRHYLQ
jgi:Mg2+ and Co2+ transporter CorA